MFGSIYFLYLELDMYFVLWTYALCVCLYLISEVGMNLLACMDIFIYVMTVIFIVSMCGMCVLFLIPCWFNQLPPNLEAKGNHLCIHFHISVSLLCIDGWHMSLIVISFIYASIMHFALLCLILIYACV